MRGLLMGTAVLLVAGAAACGPKPADGPAPVPVAVHVTNLNRSDVAVYLLRAGSRSRLGLVVSGRTTVFTVRHVRPDQMRDVQFDLQRIGAEEVYRTERVTPLPGQGIVLRIEDLLTTTVVSVREGP
ncbi:MAG TPA: hypothetical protein VEW03_02720 [Longimicrobiaceae bacterium]|nr:hypothetical protein [Longimicrobiaceae bacterium]